MSPPRRADGKTPGTWRAIYSSLFAHPDFQRLSPNARLTFLALRLGSTSTWPCIMRCHLNILVEETGLSEGELRGAFAELEKKPSPARPWVVRDDKVVWIRNGLRFEPSWEPENANQRKGLLRMVGTLPPSRVVRKFRRYYHLTPEGGSGGPKGRPQGKEPGGGPRGIYQNTELRTLNSEIRARAREDQIALQGGTRTEPNGPPRFVEIYDALRAAEPDLPPEAANAEAMRLFVAECAAARKAP